MLSITSIFHCVTQTTLTATACYTHYWGWVKNKMLGSLPALESSAAYLNLIWIIKSFDSAKTHVWGRRGNVWCRRLWVEGKGGCWKLCENEFPWEWSSTSWFWLGQKYRTSLSWNFQDLGKAFLQEVCHFCMPGFWPGPETEICARGNSLIESYLDTWELSKEVYL